MVMMGKCMLVWGWTRRVITVGPGGWDVGDQGNALAISGCWLVGESFRKDEEEQKEAFVGEEGKAGGTQQMRARAQSC